MAEEEKSHLMIPPHSSLIGPVLDFIISYSRSLGADERRLDALREKASRALSMVIGSYSLGKSQHQLRLVLSEMTGTMTVEIFNRGVPLIGSDTARLGMELSQGKGASPFFEKISVQNRGRQGQVVSLRMKLGRGALPERQAAAEQEEGEIGDDEITVRPLMEGEEGALSQLFYHVYEYNYINEVVYFPEKMQRMIKKGDLISVAAALSDGRLVGHLGLKRWNDNPPVYEPCLGLTDPKVKGRGLFRKLLKRIMEISDTIPMQYCFFDFVTNHVLSQKLVSEYKPCEVALYVGCQGIETQAKLEELGIGEDPHESNRFSILYSVIPKTSKPFEEEVLLPNNLGEMTGFLLKPLNITWSPAPRFNLLEEGGSYRMNCEPLQASVLFDLDDPGLTAIDNIIKDWRELKKEGYQYAAVEVPLDQFGLGTLYDMLAEQGFFIAGFVPYHHSSRLAFRFQALASAKVDFSEIKLYTEQAQALAAVIQEDYERNHAV
ncbi:MAG: hypothetical protein AB9903_29955 [Vulcanimicrobiota bacterium]